MRMIKIFDAWINGLEHLLFPSVCPGCGVAGISRHNIFCVSCEYNLPYTDFHLYADNQVTDIFWGRLNLEAATCLLYFGAQGIVRRIIHNLKYEGRQDVGKDLGKRLGARIVNGGVFPAVDYVIPVPLHANKKRIRGYNQSESLAEGIAEVMNIPVKTNILSRSVHNPTQTRKSREERIENVGGIFKLNNPEALEGKHILLVDDVITTGATLESCALTLLSVPGAKVSIAAIAIATV
jgi:ComF family protein